MAINWFNGGGLPRSKGGSSPTASILGIARGFSSELEGSLSALPRWEGPDIWKSQLAFTQLPCQNAEAPGATFPSTFGRRD